MDRQPLPTDVGHFLPKATRPRAPYGQPKFIQHGQRVRFTPPFALQMNHQCYFYHIYISWIIFDKMIT